MSERKSRNLVVNHWLLRDTRVGVVSWLHLLSVLAIIHDRCVSFSDMVVAGSPRGAGKGTTKRFSSSSCYMSSSCRSVSVIICCVMYENLFLQLP